MEAVTLPEPKSKLSKFNSLSPILIGPLNEEVPSTVKSLFKFKLLLKIAGILMDKVPLIALAVAERTEGLDDG